MSVSLEVTKREVRPRFITEQIASRRKSTCYREWLSSRQYSDCSQCSGIRKTAT